MFFQVTQDGGRTWTGNWWGVGGDDHDRWIGGMRRFRQRLERTHIGDHVVDVGGRRIRFEQRVVEVASKITRHFLGEVSW